MSIEIKIVSPRQCRILVPRKLLEEVFHLVREDHLSEFVTEALKGELKKTRFRKEMVRASQQGL